MSRCLLTKERVNKKSLMAARLNDNCEWQEKLCLISHYYYSNLILVIVSCINKCQTLNFTCYAVLFDLADKLKNE